MQRIDTDDGLFHDGNAYTGALGTPMKSAWANSVQEELVAVITAAGFALSGNNNAQLLAALKAAFVEKSKKATSAEVIAGADAEKYVTPVGIAALLASFSPSASPIRLPGGLILQIGGTTAPADFAGGVNRFAVTFPTAFPNGVLFIDPQIEEAADGAAAGSTVTASHRDKTRFGFTFVATEYVSAIQSIYYRWLAIGY